MFRDKVPSVILVYAIFHLSISLSRYFSSFCSEFADLFIYLEFINILCNIYLNLKLLYF